MTSFNVSIRARLIPAVALAAALMAGEAVAHPHVWITSRSDAVFNDAGRMTAVNVEWTFDEYYSVTAVEGLDTNGNGTYEPDELKGLVAENIKELKPYRYFTQVTSDKSPVEYGDVTEFGSYMKDGTLTMFFRLPLAKPLDPRASKIEYRMYDPEFYIAIEYPAKGGANIVGKAPGDCRPKVFPSEADAEEAAGNSEEFWAKLSEGGEMGALYAERVMIVCGAETQS